MLVPGMEANQGWYRAVNETIYCRYLRRNGEQCTAEAIDGDPDSEVVICQKHAAAVMRQINERLAQIGR